jgi:hypothetical protein
MEDSTRARMVEQIVAAMAEELRAVVSWLIDQQAADLRQVEAGVIERGHQLLCRLVEAVLAASPAAVSRAERVCAHCQQPLSDLGQRPKTLHLTLGDVTLRRVCGYCAACQRTEAPLDGQLGIDQSGRSPRLVETLALLGTELSFVPAADRLAQLCGIAVSASQLQQVTEAAGRTQAQEEQAAVDRAWTTGELPAMEQPPSWLVVTLDGVLVAEQAGYHEVRTGAIAGAEPPVGADEKLQLGPWHYVVTPADVPTFGQRLSLEATRQGVAQAAQVLVLGDGAHWI